MNNQLISVILPAYNGEKYLREALDSILAQNYRNIEIIIVDDGSTDQTADIAGTYLHLPNVTYIYQSNGGPASALNKGILSARGEFLAFIDHDDLWDPTKLESQLCAFLNDEKLDTVFCYTKNFAENEAADKLIFQRDPIPGYVIGCMLVRKTSFLRIGYFDTDKGKAYFWPWFGMLKHKKLNILLLEDVLHLRRVHGKNFSVCTSPGDYSDYFSAIRALRGRRKNEY